MADYLTTDWNHKIKTNPVANLILNSNNSGRKIQIQKRKLQNLADIDVYRGEFFNFGNRDGEPVWLTENEYNYMQRLGNQKSSLLKDMSVDKKYALRETWMAPLLEQQERERMKKIRLAERIAREEAKKYGYTGQALKNHIADAIKYMQWNYPDEELKEELKEAISYYFNAKARSVYAELKASRAAAKLGLRILPDDLQGEVGEALIGLFEKELGNLLEKAL